MRKYPDRRSLLLPLLWIIQEEDGYIAEDVMGEAAALCECSPAEVLEVASFYPMYNRARSTMGRFQAVHPHRRVSIEHHQTRLRCLAFNVLQECG